MIKRSPCKCGKSGVTFQSLCQFEIIEPPELSCCDSGKHKIGTVIVWHYGYGHITAEYWEPASDSQ